MSDQKTDALNSKRPFEVRVFAHFDALDSAMRDKDSCLTKLEIRVSDTEPIWEQVLKEIVETRSELCNRLDRIEAIAHETRAALRDAEDRLDKIEWDREPIQ